MDSWKRIGDIRPRYESSTLVAGCRSIMDEWPGAEALDYPDEDVKLGDGSAFVFDLNLLQPTAFINETQDAVKLVASFAGTGSRAESDTRLSAAAHHSFGEDEWGRFEVRDGLMVLTNADIALRGDEAEQPELPKSVGVPTFHNRSVLLLPCKSGTWIVSSCCRIDAPLHTFDSSLACVLRLSTP